MAIENLLHKFSLFCVQCLVLLHCVQYGLCVRGFNIKIFHTSIAVCNWTTSLTIMSPTAIVGMDRNT